MKSSRPKHLVTWAGSISVEMQLGSKCRKKPHVLMVIPQQLSHGKLQPLQRFSRVKSTRIPWLPAIETITGLHSRTVNTDMHTAYHYWHQSSCSPLRFPYSLLAFCRDFQLFGSSQENSHKGAKIPRSGIIFNLEGKKRGGENVSVALHDGIIRLAWKEGRGK